MASKVPGSKIWTTALKLVLSATAIWFVTRKIDAADAVKLIRNSQWVYALPGLVLLILSQIVSAERLKAVLRVLDINAARWWNVQLYFIGMAYNLFLPGGIGGDGYKVLVYHRKFGTARKKVLTALLVDRLSGLLAIGILLGLSLSGIGEWQIWQIPALVGIPVLCILAYLFSRTVFPSYRSVFVSVNLYALAVQLIQVASIWFLAKAMNFEVDIFYLSVLFLFSTLATTIPVFLGGIGAREGVFALLAIQFGLDEPTAVATALAFSLATVLASVPGLLFDWTLRNERAE
ncbi:MAG: flippase-like domain-containing protein [Flavobacteriales bacterium]|nr:flippase-like domain-containing protein [Flavobacteriales bacterium]